MMSESSTIVTRNYLANLVASKTGYSISESADLVNQLFDEIIKSLTNGEKVKIARFGSFEILDKKERVGRNPKTKIEAIISARRVVSFYQSNYLKNKLRKVKCE